MRYKYPSTPHLPWSPGVTSGDVSLTDMAHFRGQEVVVLEKLDGENCTIDRLGSHPRSLDPRPHPSRDWVKALAGRVGYLIPEGWRVCGENMYAQHSIAYNDLESYFYLFSVWNERNAALSWDETVMWAEELGVPTPQVLYRGPWDPAAIRAIQVDPDVMEGYVVRTTSGFAFADFDQHLAKWVRPGHVQTDQHWMHQAVVPNGLRRQ
ncbi:RNA ligase family protein [Deinococcus hopiensis]|uniref:RNA ligase n=1 Tax=Deinococcus hopiensis KR-140 TaxID=695939 RepID=A0A1W1UKG8_9DEIO|nr:RNA ligase family protein [Deinococcus hopiensis]SMB81542.1 RNA ligase [Deinococcus hopiensis KR-140]